MSLLQYNVHIVNSLIYIALVSIAMVTTTFLSS